MPPHADVKNVELPLERDSFLLSVVRELSGTLQDVVGVDDASGYISVVGAALGRQINAAYKAALDVDRLSRQQVSDVLVDLKRRIDGRFFVLEESPERIVFGASRCPFGDHVLGRPSLCMMTSNVFGYIAAENTGYAKVEIEQAIATGDPGCRVVVEFQPAHRSDTAREYFSTVDLALG